MALSMNLCWFDDIINIGLLFGQKRLEDILSFSIIRLDIN